MKATYRYIVVEGNIGAGKTTLATRLAKDMDARLMLERFADNPFLPKFYAAPRQHAFPLELSFLAERFRQMKNTVMQPDLFKPTVVADYLFHKCLLFASVNLDADEYSLFSGFFDMMNAMLPQPDLLIYLHQNTERLLKNIEGRGRTFEQAISEDYLQKIEEGYLGYIRQHPAQRILVLDAAGIDFVNNEKHYQAVCNLAQSEYQPGIHRFSSEQLVNIGVHGL